MLRNAWFWMGWGCLAGALAGIFSDQIATSTQILFLCVALLAFDRYGAAVRSDPPT